MSRVYQALKRVELERDLATRAAAAPAPPAREADTRAHVRSWWRGACVGFAAGLVLAAAAWSGATWQRPAGVLAVVSAARATTASLATQPRDRARATEAVPDAGRAAGAAADVTRAAAPGAELAAAAASAVTAAAVEPATQIAPHAAAPVAIQVGSFRDQRNAVRLAATLRDDGYAVVVERGADDAAAWTVRVGAYEDRRAATRAREALERAGLETFLVVRRDR